MHPMLGGTGSDMASRAAKSASATVAQRSPSTPLKQLAVSDGLSESMQRRLGANIYVPLVVVFFGGTVCCVHPSAQNLWYARELMRLIKDDVSAGGKGRPTPLRYRKIA